jgi:hypothetical protein
MTYARRYAISSILGISSQSDDDGNLVSGRDNKRNEEEPPKIEITGAMCEALDKLAQSKGYTHDEIIRIIQQRYNKDEYKYLTAREYATLKNSIEKAKAKNPKPEPDPQPDPPKDPNGGKPIESIDPEDGFTPDPEDIPPYDEGDIPPVLQSDENAAAPVPPEKATPDPSEGKKEDKSLSQAKINKLMAISASKGMTEAELKSLIKDMFKKSSRKNLSEDEYKLLIATIEARPEKVINLDKARENKEVVEVGFMHKGTMKITVVKDPWLLDKYRCDPDFEEIK